MEDKFLKIKGSTSVTPIFDSMMKLDNQSENNEETIEKLQMPEGEMNAEKLFGSQLDMSKWMKERRLR